MKSSQKRVSVLVVAPLAVLLLVLGCGTGQKAAQEQAMADSKPAKTSVEDKDLGLDKNDVFATPDPIVASVVGGEPGDNKNSAAYFEGAPPSIPHQIEDFLPIRTGDNQCLECHDDVDSIGQPVEQGDPTPIPATHYTDLRRAPDQVTGSLIGARYVCIQCHTPLHDAVPLVVNTYKQ